MSIKNRISPELEKRIVDDMERSRVSMMALAVKWGVHENTLRRVAKRNGINLRGRRSGMEMSSVLDETMTGNLHWLSCEWK